MRTDALDAAANTELTEIRRWDKLRVRPGVTSRELPLSLALAAGYADQFTSCLLRREPRIPLDGVRMARHKMFVRSSKAEVELGYQAGSVEATLERAVCWYRKNDYFTDAKASAIPRGRPYVAIGESGSK